MKALMKMISVINATYDTVIRYLAYLSAVILFFITLSITLDVFLRYFMNETIKWVFEGTEYALLFITFLSATWVLKKDGHVKLDLVLNALGERAQAWFNVFSSLVIAGVCMVTTWSSANYTLYLYQQGVTLTKYYTVPQFALFIVIPTAFFLLFVQSLKRAYYYSMIIKQVKA